MASRMYERPKDQEKLSKANTNAINYSAGEEEIMVLQKKSKKSERPTRRNQRDQLGPG